MRYVNFLLLMCLSVNAAASEYDDYENKTGECFKLTHRKIESVNDFYFQSLTLKQKSILLGELSTITMNRCVAYEEAQFFKYAIRTGSHMDILEMVSSKIWEPHSTIEIRESLNESEIERLSKTELFNTPFDALYLLQNIEKQHE